MNNAQNTQYAALILRLSLGMMLIAHGLLKVMIFTVPGTVQFFSSVGFPGWMAYIVIAVEIGGGVLVISHIPSAQSDLSEPHSDHTSATPL